MAQRLARCGWAGDQDFYLRYHDEEWGVPLHDDRMLFEFLVLEGAQAGLSWSTILRKRDGYRRAFHEFDPARVARYGARDVSRLLADASIVRNRLKIESAIGNARAFLEVQGELGSFDAYIWAFVAGTPIQNGWRSLDELPASTDLSDQISRDLKKRGFRFVGSTIVYAIIIPERALPALAPPTEPSFESIASSRLALRLSQRRDGQDLEHGPCRTSSAWFRVLARRFWRNRRRPPTARRRSSTDLVILWSAPAAWQDAPVL